MEDIKLLEEKRKKCAKLVGTGIPLAVVGFVCFVCASFFPMAIVGIGFALVVVGMVLICLGSVTFKKISQTIKMTLLPKLIKEVLGDNMKYNPNAGLSEKQVCSTRIVPRGDRYHSEDLISGVYENVELACCDVKVEEEHTSTDSDGHTTTSYVPIFVGRFFDFKFPHVFKGEVVLSETRPKVSGLDKVQLESVAFNKKFKTFADKDVNAFYILTPHVMEAIERIEAKYKGVVSFQFVGSHVLVAINNNVDTFELKLFRPIDGSESNGFKEDLLCIIDLIKEIKTNRIYKEEE